MSKLEELIQKYCPDGVEYRPLWSLTAWDKKFNGIEDKSKQKRVIKYNYLLAADLKSYQVEGGIVKLLTTNISNLYTSEELAEGLASDGEVVAIPWGGNPVVQYYKGRFLTADNRIATSLDTTLLNNKFLYYCMLSQLKLIASFYRGSGIKHPDMAKVLELEIPIPPLPVQEEIVRVLDTFTELQAELQAELQKRLQQYNYYRDNLLSFEGRTDVEWKKLGEVANVYDGTHQTPSYKDSGIPFISVENIGDIYSSRKYISKEDFDKYKIKPQVGDVFMTRIGSIGVCAVFDKQAEIAYYVSLALIRPNQEYVLPRYLKHIIESLTGCKELRKRTLVNAVPIKVNKDDIGKIVLPFPSLSEQQRIVDVLDRFDTLTIYLTAGLPAEIEKRRQQYEYYRDKLLTFKKKEA